MKDGLECSEISLQQIVTQTYDLRMESEYYRKKYLNMEAILDAADAKMLKDGMLRQISDGTHVTPDYVEDGVPFLSALNVQGNYLDLDAGYKFVSRETHSELVRRTAPEAGDVLVRKVGVGLRKACVIPPLPFSFSIFVSVALLKPEMDPYCLSTYINSKYGQDQLLRFNKGISQPDLHLEDILRLRVPRFSPAFARRIAQWVKEANRRMDEAKAEYKSAEEILLSDLSALEKPEAKGTEAGCVVAERSYSESFGHTGRLDAEYYQEKYRRYEALLHTEQTVASLCRVYDANYLPDEKQRFSYIELSNVGNFGEIRDVRQAYGSELPTRARRKVRAGQVLIPSIEGSLQHCALIPKAYEGAVCSNGFYIIDAEKIQAETLLVLFKTKPMQELMKQRCSGTILTAISPDEFLHLPMPVVGEETQRNVTEKVRASFAARSEAETMLEQAGKAMECAVENGETVALGLLS